MLAGLEEPRRSRDPQIDVVRGQLADEPVPPLRRVAEFERLDRRGGQPALLGVRARRRALGFEAEHAMEERRRQLVGGVNLLLFAARARGFGRLLGECDPGPAREHARGFRERNALEQLNELDRVAALPAAEALEEAAIGMDVKRGRVLGMKRAEPD